MGIRLMLMSLIEDGEEEGDDDDGDDDDGDGDDGDDDDGDDGDDGGDDDDDDDDDDDGDNDGVGEGGKLVKVVLMTHDGPDCHDPDHDGSEKLAAVTRQKAATQLQLRCLTLQKAFGLR